MPPSLTCGVGETIAQRDDWLSTDRLIPAIRLGETGPHADLDVIQARAACESLVNYLASKEPLQRWAG